LERFRRPFCFSILPALAASQSKNLGIARKKFPFISGVFSAGAVSSGYCAKATFAPG
jgi:hypothetical protein